MKINVKLSVDRSATCQQVTNVTEECDRYTHPGYPQRLGRVRPSCYPEPPGGPAIQEDLPRRHPYSGRILATLSSISIETRGHNIDTRFD